MWQVAGVGPYWGGVSYDCQSCGACCFSDSSAYIPVRPEEVTRLSRSGEDLLHAEDGSRYMRMEHGRCVALTLVGRRFVCAIYDRRPSACHELQRGTPECRAEIQLKKARALRMRDA